MRVLISAYACSPTKASEPAIGWNWAVQAAERHEVWLLTRPDNKESIQSAMAESPSLSIHPIYHDLPSALRWLRHVKGIVYLHYWLWQMTAIRLARNLRRLESFDLGHHVTYVSFRGPSFLAWLGIPYIWGPVAGADRPSIRFYRTMGKRGMLIQVLRDASNLLTRLDPAVRKTARRSACIIAVTEQNRAWLPKDARQKTIIMPAIGMGAGEFMDAPHRRNRPKDPIRFLYVGNLLPLKGLQLALPALARAIRQRPEVDIRFTIVGDGPFKKRLADLSRRLEIADQVDFAGKLDRNHLKDLYASHHVFVFPSMRDSGGMAVLEAMAAGMPVICLDLGGPGLSVTNETGWRVEATSPKEVIETLSQALLASIDDPGRCAHAGDMARARVHDVYNWDRLTPLLDRLYEAVAAQSTERRTRQATPGGQPFEHVADIGAGNVQQNC